MKGFYKTNKSKIKKYLAGAISVIVITVALISIPQHTAHAQDGLTSFLGFPNLGDLVVQMVAEFVNLNLQLASWILAISGFLLNFSMSVTLNIKAFVEATPAIFTVWKAIRDISGMAIIFLLLFAAIKMILGQDSKMSALIKTIVMAGILINFSFFITGLGIDVSNVVSLQLYNAIAPANKLTGINSLNPSNVEETIRDGGISDIFMQSLKIVNLYDVRTLQLKNNGDVLSPSLKIILIGFVGIIIIYTAALSFFLAALAFIVRFVILLFLLAFSPIWLASYAIPQLDDYAKKWTSLYKNQLLFMPVYLLLMYFAMSVMTSNKFFGSAYVGNLTTNGAWYANFLTIAVNAVLVILMLNAPLVAALGMGAMIPKKFSESLTAGNIWKKIGGFTGGMAGRNLIGRPMGAIDRKIGDTKYGNKLFARDIRAVTTGAAAKGKYGGSRSLEEIAKAQKDVAKKQKELDRTNNLKNIIASGTATSDQYRDIIKSMTDPEKLKLGTKVLANPNIIRHLKKNDFESIKKADENDISNEDKRTIAQARKDTFTNAVTNNKFDVAKDMMKNMDIDDISDTPAHLLEDAVIANLKPEHLKKISDSAILSDAQKRILGNKIDVWSSNTIANPGGLIHPAQVFVNKSTTNAAGARVTEWL